jgi:exonuclease SbcC
MRPIKITITAMGPYKHKEVIDFTDLKDNKLFVVSGNTGAGKTTIFDAICFALYGTASGEDRSDSKSMRSDFAEDDVHTAVEFEFTLQDRHYRILRQLPHKKKGNKGATGEKYEFYVKVDGQEVPCVDRQIVSEINKKMEALVGLTKDQFSQIVMLPQGEFRKLLTSQTENKEAILRKIFRTEPYRWISERLNEKRKVKVEEYNRESQTRDRYIADISATIPERDESKLFETLSQEHYNTNQVISGLEEETVFYENEIVKKKKELETANLAYNQKLEAFHKAEVVNGEFKRLEEREAQLHDLTEQVPVFKVKEQKLENAERATKVEAYEFQVNEWREDEKAKKQKLINAEVALEKAGEQLEKAQKTYNIEKEKNEDRENVVRTLDRYNELLQTVREIDSKKTELSTIEKQVEKLADDLTAVKGNISKEKSAKEQLSKQMNGMVEAVDQFADKQQNLLEKRDQVRILHDYLQVNKKQMELEKEYNEKQQMYEVIKEKYDALEEAWVKGQASILAAHLHDGKPCPVCGSSDHPNKAADQDLVPTKEEYQNAKTELDSEYGSFADAAAQVKTNKEQLEARALEVAEMGVQAQGAQLAYNQLVEQKQELEREVEDLKKKREALTQLRKEVEMHEEMLKKLETTKEEIEQVFHEQKTAFETKKAVYEEQISHIPAEIRVLSVLEQKMAETKALKEKLEKAWEDAQNQLQLAKEAETKKSSEATSAKTQLEESLEKKERAEKQFTDALQQADFSSEEVYRQAKMMEAARQQLKEEIEQFTRSLATTKQQVIDLQESLKGKVKADLIALRSELDQLKEAYEQSRELVRKSELNHQQTLALKTKILDVEKSTAEMERQLSVFTDLYDVVRGQNSSKISFERYLQIEFLEHIIIAANERLSRLSNGQFHLMRSERQESHGKQSGLGLDVFDAYTGQTRDVKTLSGGEKFNASLCLALGMADVIQSYQGGISIDTMFIDEGFGSLDEESLNKAIDTLIDLQKSGRMIGVISHVQELKNALPATLEVKKAKEGYSRTEFVLK